MNRVGVLAYTTAIVAIVALFTREVGEAGAHLIEMHSSKMVALGAGGWLISTLGPLVLSMFAWFLSQRRKPQWLWHLLFIPGAIALYNLGASILFYAAEVPDGDSIEGYTLVMALGLLGLTLILHGVAALWFMVAGRRASVRERPIADAKRT